MPTHAIGEGKALIVASVDLETSLQLGRRSYSEIKYKSKSAIVRKLVELYLSGAITLPLVALATLGIAAVACQSVAPSEDSPVIARRVLRIRGRREDLVSPLAC